MFKKLSTLFFLLHIFFINSYTYNTPVIKETFDNGFTVLIYPSKKDASLQLWVKTGSKHEQSNEKGLAHALEHILLEHMLSKGIDILFEKNSDISADILANYCNAETFYDWTRYYFTLPVEYTLNTISVLADTFSNAAFTNDHIDLAVKTIIQEFKQSKDHYNSSLSDKLLGTLLPDHPYRDPIMGYKQNILNMNHNTLMKFYKKHYIPNNAFLVVVGNVNPDEIIASAKEHFGDLTPNFEYTQPARFHNQDLSQTAITLYRDVERPLVKVSFLIPGTIQLHPSYLPNILAYLLAGDKGSLLYKKLVDELDLVYNISSRATSATADYNRLSINFEPKNTNDIGLIINTIGEKISELKNSTTFEDKLELFAVSAKENYDRFFENNFALAGEIALNYLGKNNENYIFNINFKEITQLQSDLISLINMYIRPSLMHIGCILPIKDTDKEYWQQRQEKSDQEDREILAHRA